LAAELLASTQGRPANLIARLDDYCVQYDGQNLPDGYQDGPFGVFETRHAGFSTATDEDAAAASSSQNCDTLEPTASADIDTIERTAELDALVSPPEGPPSNESVEEIVNVHQRDDSLNTAIVQSSSEHDFWHMDDPFSFMDDFNMPTGLLTGDDMGFDVFDSTSPLNTDGFPGLVDNVGAARNSPTPPPPGAYAHLLAEAPLLLRYYQHEVNSSRPAKQSFWRSFVLPSAMHTFAALTVFGQASDLSSSAFYSILANSAFAMQRSDDPHWHMVGKAAEDAARRYLQKALQSPQPDCKELLTATLSLGLVSVSRSMK